MVKKKDSISSNFENLKAQMLKKRELAENISNQVISEPIIEKKPIKYENKDVYINDDKDVDVNKNIYDDGSVSDNENIGINKFVIKKAEKKEMPKRITYYLKPSTIQKIDKLSKKAGMGKSEFVQKILEDVLENLEIR
ncbi:hypothetical protein ADU80_11410 [Clostridium botulinum]|uniref:Uncharacterized protein n=1 Tax=Clostridium botulinum TaxID=1491 RepID=A0A9Q1UWX4_CLOBO|nr:hypothetical protein [Clostridium botulinum]AEB77587.1 hypothetical protein CbC4_6066 [Clostridium botulinum BKT015925]KEH95983.1 hypothetical protein Y848_p0159 [Clostridium botulinum C/D str. Sp77]KOA77693.1 hypothetical protein ADU77_07380 [Clostridium botulinum]KOA80614.1 hypothetical protein ADU75_14280 [Clostridium botulinum]KOA83658.1 hypothetical protein ADU74_12045 [Clostridium botulinum]